MLDSSAMASPLRFARPSSSRPNRIRLQEHRHPGGAMSDATASDPILYNVDGHVATITTNRPERYNSLNLSLIHI